MGFREEKKEHTVIDSCFYLFLKGIEDFSLSLIVPLSVNGFS